VSALRWPTQTPGAAGSLLSECSENPRKSRQYKSRIFAAFHKPVLVFLKYRLSEHRRPATLRQKGRGKMTKSQGKRVSKRVAIYLRVSTTEQTTTNQRRQLHAVAKRHGWTVVQVFEDAGISGAKGRKDRPALDALLKSVARREVDMVAAWSVDRLGRSLTDLLDFLRELHAKGVDLFLHQQGLDTSTPSGRAMFQMMGVFAEFERAMIRERVLAGLARAKEQGISLGRRRLEDSDAAKVAAIKRALAAKRGVRRIARDLETGVGTVLRIKNELAA
jgi:DNA invertase Pin-like site-specific DNA recombinase